MKKEKSTNTAIRITPSEKESLENAAKEMGITFTDLLKTGATFYASLDPIFRKWIRSFSGDLGIQEYLVFQNLVLSWVARREAHEEVFGFQDPLLEEFQFTDKGPITGEELNRILKQKFKKEYEDEKETTLRSKVARGISLSEEDQLWLQERP